MNMNYITAKELSEKWDISSRRICILCKDGRIPGAIKKGNTWMIPANTQKPEDGRKAGIKTGINPLFLLYNPTFFEEALIEPIKEEELICIIQEKFLRGNISEAYSDINKALCFCTDNRYRWIYYCLKFVIGTDLGVCDSEREIAAIPNDLVEADKYFWAGKKLLDMFYGKGEDIVNLCISDDSYDGLIPFVGLIWLKNSINKSMSQSERSDISCLELFCYEIEKRDCLLISAYMHLQLAIYYNIEGNQREFERHYNKALDILLPRKWYTPLAEYALTVDIKYIESIDREAYLEVERLAEKVICAYMKIGLFDKFDYKNKEKYSCIVQVGYKLFQGKSIDKIAEELCISQYKVKKRIDDLFFITGVNTKNELREMILKNSLV